MTIVQQDVSTTAPPGMARYLVGRKVDGEWGTYWCKLRNLHEHPDACLLGALPSRYQQGVWIESRIPITSIPVVPDHTRILAQDGQTDGGFGETGYVSGAALKQFYLGEIGTVTFVGKQVDGDSCWMTPGQEMNVRAAWDGGAPGGQLLFQWEVRQGPVELIGDTTDTVCTLRFTGGPAEAAQVMVTVRHKWKDWLTPQSPRLMVLGVSDVPQTADS